jgi:hypothetical protein
MKAWFVCCEVFMREVCAAIAASPNQIDPIFLPKGLHDRGGKAMVVELQKAIDQANPGRHDTVLLGYALCNNGIVGLRANTLPMVAYRAHDCIACLLGSRERYDTEFKAQPGTYWYSAGWIERGESGEHLSPPAIPDDSDPQWRKLVAKYGEDNARFLWEELRAQTAHYTRLAYIDTGVGPQPVFTAAAEKKAAERQLPLQRLQGDVTWIQDLVHGRWDDQRFLRVPPAHHIIAKYDGSLMGAAAV